MFLFGPLPVSILNPNQKFSILIAGKKKIKQGGSGTADMQLTGGTWGKTNAQIHTQSLANLFPLIIIKTASNWVSLIHFHPKE